jgi:hypothetical protein
VAPHGRNRKKKDDVNTDLLGRKLAHTLQCSALINDTVSRDDLDYNRVNQAGTDKVFIRNLRQVLDAKGLTLVVWVHGIGGKTNRLMRAEMGLTGKLDCLVGFGQPDRHTAKPDFVARFIGLCSQKGLSAYLAPEGSDYCGWSKNNMNQWCRRRKKYKNLDSVQSIQFEFSGFRRRRRSLDETARVVSEVLIALVRPEQTIPDVTNPMSQPVGLVPEVLGQTPVSTLDEGLADQAYDYLKEVFRKHVQNAIYEAGRYLIDTFFEADPYKALDKESPHPISLNLLIKRLQKNSGDAPSKSWFYDAVNLVAHEMICQEVGFQSFGKLQHSYKLLLLPVPKFEDKERLAKEAREKGYSVSEFRKRIREEFPRKHGNRNGDIPSRADLAKLDTQGLRRAQKKVDEKIDCTRK